MAGPSIGTWVKVKNKSGRTTARVLAKKYGGGSYQQGEVITQSEYNAFKEKRAEAKSQETARSVTAEVVTDPPRRKSRFKQLMDDVDNLYKGETNLDNRVTDTMARAGRVYSQSLSDAGVKPGGRSTPQRQETPALPGGTSRRGRGRLGRIADDMEAVGKATDKNQARGLGVTAKMVDTTRKLEERRQGRKKLAGKRKQRKLNGN